ncbi:MAG: hypothetical protein LUC43_08435 [Burkholderiales bacterium]|nr:hypothetical protein [Burkholderiales bacterium]
MRWLFHSFVVGLQLANAVIIAVVIMNWMNICPSCSMDFLSMALAIGGLFFFFYLLPSSAVVAGGLVFYYVVWICKLNPVFALCLALPAIAISLIAMWNPGYEEIIVDHIESWIRRLTQ